MPSWRGQGKPYIYLMLNDALIYKGKAIPLQAVPWLRRLVADLSPRMPGFDPGSVHVGFEVDKVALGQVFSRVLRFSTVNFIPSVLHYTEN